MDGPRVIRIAVTLETPTGKRPDGSDIKSPMPWQATAQMSEVEMKALYLFLKAPPADRAALSQR